MNRDDIIRMAREAGFASVDFWPDDFQCLFGCVERFAALVAAAERKACAKVCDQTESDLWGVYKGLSKDDRLGRGRGSEYVQGGSDTAGLLARAIRAGVNE